MPTKVEIISLPEMREGSGKLRLKVVNSHIKMFVCPNMSNKAL